MTKKRLGIILLIAALLGFAIYEKALETQVDQQYRIESNMPEWDGQTAVLKGTLKYNDFRIGTMRFSGSVRIGEHELEYLDGLPLDYPDRRDAGAVCPTRFYMDRGTGQDIPPLQYRGDQLRLPLEEWENSAWRMHDG